VTSIKFSFLLTLSTTADLDSAGIDRFARLLSAKLEHQQRIADAYHAFKDVDGFAKVASLADIRANDGNLSIPLYVRGKGVGDEKGEYAADGLLNAIRLWNESAERTKYSIAQVLQILESKK